MHFPHDWKFARVAILAATCACTAPAADFVFGDFNVGPPGVPTLNTGAGRMSTSFFDVFFDVSVPGLPADSFFDIFYDITLVRHPGPSGLPHEPVPIELVALQLHAANPITIQVGSQPTNLWEIRTVFPPPQQNQVGPTLGTDLGGGNFRIDSFFDVFVELEIPGLPPIPARNGTANLTNTVPDGAPTAALLLLALAALGARRLRTGG